MQYTLFLSQCPRSIHIHIHTVHIHIHIHTYISIHHPFAESMLNLEIPRYQVFSPNVAHGRMRIRNEYSTGNYQRKVNPAWKPNSQTTFERWDRLIDHVFKIHIMGSSSCQNLLESLRFLGILKNVESITTLPSQVLHAGSCVRRTDMLNGKGFTLPLGCSNVAA